MTWVNLLKTFRQLTRIKNARRVYLYAILVGVFSGFAALGFSYLLALVEDFTFHQFAGIDLGYAQGEFSLSTNEKHSVFKPIVFFLLPIFGLFISGLFVQLLDKKAGGAGTDALIHAFHEEEGRIQTRTPIVKALATVATLSGAGSAGKEGPIAHIGSGIGSLFGQLLGCGPRASRSLFIAGMAGALGAIFRAPLGAAIVAVEVLYREDFESDSLIPAILSSITGYFIFTLFRGFNTVFQMKDQMFSNWEELFFYFILGIACFIFGYLFVKIYHSIQERFSELKLPISIRALIGGIFVALIGLLSEESIGSGFGFLQKLMREEELHSMSILGSYFFSPENIKDIYYIVIYLLIIILLKMLATAFTIGSGASGGVFGPSIFIGGILGAAIGLLANHFFPHIVLSPVPYLVVGMAGFFAGVANAPIGSVIMVCELTGSYQLLAPLLVVAVLSIILSSRFNIYKGQKQNKFHSPAHSWDMKNDILSEIQVKQVYHKINQKTKDPQEDAPNILLKETFLVKNIFQLSNKINEYDFIIIDDKNKYLGIFSLAHLTKAKKEKLKNTKDPILLHSDQTGQPLKLNDTLSTGLDLLISLNTSKAPVVNEHNKVVGYLGFRKILSVYQKNVGKIKMEA